MSRDDRFSLLVNGSRKQFRELPAHKHWQFTDGDGITRWLPEELRSKPRLSQAEASPYASTLEAACIRCRATGNNSHSSSCEFKGKTTSKAATIAAQAKGRTNILDFLASRGAANSIKSTPITVAPNSTGIASAAGPDTASSVAGSFVAAPVLAEPGISTGPPSSAEQGPAQAPSSSGHSKKKRRSQLNGKRIEDNDEEESIQEQSCFSAVRPIILEGLEKIKSSVKPETLHYIFPELPQRNCEPGYHAIKQSTFFVWDPIKQFPARMGDRELECPECSDVLISKGYCTSSIRIERGAGVRARLLVTTDLRCTKCSDEGKPCSFNSAHPCILRQLPDTVREEFPFVATPNGAFISIERLNSIISMLVGGTSFNAIETQFEDGVVSELFRLEKLRRDLYIHRKQSPFEALPEKLPADNVHDFAALFSLTTKVMCNFLVAECVRREGLIQQSFRNAILGTHSLHIDMLFPWGNDGSTKGETGIWVILNGYGEVVAVRSATTKSLDDAAGLLTQIAQFAGEHKHRIAVVFTDNPAIDASAIRSAFGDDVAVCKDVFHLICALFDCTKKNAKNRMGWENAVLNAFYWFHKEDIDAEEKKLKDAKVENYDKLLKSASYLRSRKRIRHFLRKPAISSNSSRRPSPSSSSWEFSRRMRTRP